MQIHVTQMLLHDGKFPFGHLYSYTSAYIPPPWSPARSTTLLLGRLIKLVGLIWKCRAQALTAATATITAKAKVHVATPAEEAPLTAVSTQHPTCMLGSDHTSWACST